MPHMYKCLKEICESPAIASLPEAYEKFNAAQIQAQEANTSIEQRCLLNFKSEPLHNRMSGIICTIGPASRDVAILKQMIANGMCVARLNFSHGTHEYHTETVCNIKEAVKQLEKEGTPVVLAIALDTKGPEIRTGSLKGDTGLAEVELKKGSTVKLVTDDKYLNEGTAELIYIDYKNITKVLEVGKTIYIDDGLMSLICVEKGDDWLNCVVENEGMLGSHKGCNLPGTPVDLPGISEKDRGDLIWGVKTGVDIVFASFIRTAQHVKDIRCVLGEKGKDIQVICKIENHQGIENFDAILQEVDGVMAARGDMGIEIPAEKVFVVQKMMFAKCNLAGKPAICATQMLESMTHKPRPTRAEANDVANAVLDGADCVMLSGESAKGDYPLKTVDMMHLVCREAEAAIFYPLLYSELSRIVTKANKALDKSHTLAISAVEASFKSQAQAIVVVSATGKSAKFVAKYRPRCPIIVVSENDQAARQCQVFRGLFPLICKGDQYDDDYKRAAFGIQTAVQRKFITSKGLAVIVFAEKHGEGHINTMRIVSIKDYACKVCNNLEKKKSC